MYKITIQMKYSTLFFVGLFCWSTAQLVAEEKIAPLFQALRAFNESLEDASPIHAVVVPIEQSL